MTTTLRGFWVISLLIVLFVSSADAAKVVFPGAAPCNGTMQKCIDGIQEGDTVLIAVNQVDEDLNINKSLTLAPAPGFSGPVIGGGATTRKIDVTQGPNGKTVDVRIIQLSLVNAYLGVYFWQGSGHSVHLLDSLILSNNSFNAVWIQSNVASSFNIERNQIIAGQKLGISFTSGSSSGVHTDLLIHGNRITSANQASSDGGIELTFYGHGSNHVRVLSNVIYKVAENAFQSAIRVNPLESTNNDLKFFNNTIDNSLGHGLEVTSPLIFSHTDVVFNNNIVSNTDGNWIQLPFSTSAVTASFDHNTYYLAGTAGYGGYTPGGDNDNQNPMYFNSGNANYRLVYPSPCINTGAGQTNDIGFSDLSGWPRIIGLIPDRGAYESDGNPLGPYVTFNDKFDNSAIDPGYTYLKGSWSEDSESLLGISDRKASMFFPDSVTCISCRVHFRVKNSGRENGISPKIWVVLWYADKSNYIDLLIRPESNKAILRQRLNGTIVAKEKIDILIEPFDGYSFDIQKTGGLINVRKEDGTLLQVPLAGSFGAGKFGFQAKGTYAYLSEFAIYYQ